MGRERSTSDYIILALDVSTRKEAEELARELKGDVGAFKVGLELITASGGAIVNTLSEEGIPIFYDGKFLDIPNTVARAAEAVTRLGVAMFNVHALGGAAMMAAAVEAAESEASRLGIEKPALLAVTILTSVDRRTMNKELRIDGEVEDEVVALARLAASVGVDGVIASPKEIGAIREAIPSNMLIVTPGVRPAWAAMNDQKRVLTPGEAIAAGATHLVVGRPITKAPEAIGSPREAAREIAREIEMSKKASYS
jgi:orotidine-5'-phosphate decarboxylase